MAAKALFLKIPNFTNHCGKVMSMIVSPMVNDRISGLGMLTFAFVLRLKAQSLTSQSLASCCCLTGRSPAMCSAALRWELPWVAVPVGARWTHTTGPLCTAAAAPPAVRSGLPCAVRMQFTYSPLRMGSLEAVPGMWNGHVFPGGRLLEISCWGNLWNNSFKYLQVLILLSHLPPFAVVYWS